jgi:hypothetical protein
MERLCIKPGESDELNSLNINKLKTYLADSAILPNQPNRKIKSILSNYNSMLF